MNACLGFKCVLALAALAGASACATNGQLGSAPAASLDEQERRFAADFDAFLTASLARLRTVPGLSVAVARSDGPIFVRGYGMADIERRIAATSDARFYIASSTKSFVALALALMDRRGAIDLDWTLAELAPDIRFAPEIRANEVTLRHMLSHSHGFTQNAMQHRLAYSGEHDPQTLWRLLANLQPNREAPLGRFDYGNIGYNVATLLLERRLGRRWQELVRDEVLRPLRLTQTHAEGLERLRATQPVSAPYFGAAPGGPDRLNLIKVDSNMQSAGGLFASANDLARWVSLQLAARRGVRGLPVPADVVAATHEPVVPAGGSFGPFQRPSYGLGWYSGPLGGETLFHSFGGYTGARSHVSFLPARDIGVAIVTNDEAAGSPFTDIAALYAYTWFAEGPEAARRAAAPMMDRLATEAQRRTDSIAADRARRASRSWQLSLPRSAYSGRYCHPEYGTIEVAAGEDRIAVRMGEMNSIATPFTERDSIRVELIPGSGVPIPFTVEGGRVTALRAFDTSFTRCG